MEVVYARNNQQVSVCTDCHSGITISFRRLEHRPRQTRLEVNAEALAVDRHDLNRGVANFFEKPVQR
jgi:hypothetical protein